MNIWGEAAGSPLRRAFVITFGAAISAAAGFLLLLVVCGALSDSGQAG